VYQVKNFEFQTENSVKNSFLCDLTRNLGDAVMAVKSLAVILAISTIVSGVHSQIVLTQNHEEITVKQGDEAELVCSSEFEALGCSFRSPLQTPYNLLKGAKYEQGRIEQSETGNPNDCAMKITDIKETDNGEWECSVTAKGSNGDFQIGTGKVQVIVAVPPELVQLKMDGQPITGPIDMNLDNQQQAMIDCVATGARPAPEEFRWFIGATLLDANTKINEVAGENGKMTYTSTLEYNAAPKHSGQMVKCEVDHKGYTAQQLDDRSNWAEETLNLQFKPDEKTKPETFYGMKEGESNTVRFKFRANPKPTSGKWMLGAKSVPIGAADTENTIQSSQIENGDFDGEYQVELKFTMDAELAGKPYSLEIENDLGKTIYGFNLALDDKPPADKNKGPVIGIIVLVVIIILVGAIIVIARAKGALCFGGKKQKEEDTEQAVDKEGSDTESAEDTTPKDEADEADETDNKEVTEDKKEDKKSAASGMVNRVSNLFAAMKKSVKKPKDSKYSAETPESEMKLHENEEKKDGENDTIVYADLDKSALGTGTRRESVENEKTEYAEIRPQD